MKTSTIRRVTIVLTLTLLLLPALAEAGRKTHVGVKSRDIISLNTGVVPADNSSGHEFHYDNSGPVFSVPKNMSFVVTDIEIVPNSSSFASSNQYWVVINISNGGYRIINARWTGGNGYFRSLTTGIVMPADTTPTARNTTMSTHGVIIQLQGYFVKGPGLPSNSARF